MSNQSATRKWVSVGIASFLATQLLLPLSYYVGEGGHDERFAWRMFSPVRLAGCTVTAMDHSGGSPQTIRLNRELHVVWVNLLKRARTAVVESAVNHLCTQRGGPEVADVRLTLDCRTPNGVSLGICIDKADRNGDGIPDGYKTAPTCQGEAPADCYARDCRENDPEQCYQTRCRMLIHDGSQNLCEAGAL